MIWTFRSAGWAVASMETPGGGRGLPAASAGAPAASGARDGRDSRDDRDRHG